MKSVASAGLGKWEGMLDKNNLVKLGACRSSRTEADDAPIATPPTTKSEQPTDGAAAEVAELDF